MASSFLVGFVVLSGLLTPTALAQEDTELLFDEGVNLYNRGHYDEALQAFQGVLAENPSHDMAFKLWNKAGHKIFLKMLLQEGEFESVAKRYIELAKTGRKEKQEDGDRIRELVGLLVSGDQREQSTALLTLIADHGEYTIEYIYTELAGDDLEALVNVMTSLARMGEEVVLPLIQVLGSDESLIRRNAAAVLGNIGDPRAMAALKNMMESDENEENRGVAGKSLAKLTTDVAALPSASDLYLMMAMGYLNRDDRVLKPYLQSRVIWKWRDGGLTKSPVDPGLYALELAEDNCFHALACNPGSEQAVAMLAFTFAAQKAEVDAALAQAGGDASGLSDALQGAIAQLTSAEKLVALAGPDGLNKALQFALDNDHSLVAVELLNTMSSAGVSGDSVHAALAGSDKLVRYHAALTLAKAGVHTSDVVGVLVKALGESAVRQVLVIDSSSDTRNTLLHDLSEAGYFAVGAENGAAGLLRAKAYPRKDLVILNVGVKDLTTDKVVYEMASGFTADIPIMLVASAYEMEAVQNIWEGKVAGLIPSPPAKDAYLPMVLEVLGEAMNSEREMAMVVSREAGLVLAGMDKGLLTPYLNDFISGLNKPDNVKISVLAILACLGDPAALESVKNIFGDEGAATEVRVAAAKALGAMFTNLSSAPDAEVLGFLAGAMGSEEIQLSSAAAGAIGKARDLPQGFVDTVLVENRID